MHNSPRTNSLRPTIQRTERRKHLYDFDDLSPTTEFRVLYAKPRQASRSLRDLKSEMECKHAGMSLEHYQHSRSLSSLYGPTNTDAFFIPGITGKARCLIDAGDEQHNEKKTPPSKPKRANSKTDNSACSSEGSKKSNQTQKEKKSKKRDTDRKKSKSPRRSKSK